MVSKPRQRPVLPGFEEHQLNIIITGSQGSPTARLRV
jgi:hypothetical protein